MSSKRNDHETSQRVVVPVIVRHGKLMPFYGGTMPAFKEGRIMDLITEVDAFTDQTEVARFHLEEVVTILPPETTLFALMIEQPPKGVPVANFKPDPRLSKPVWFVPFLAKEEVQLRLRGTRHAELEPCQCQLTSLGAASDMVSSINEAYTRLSERYEPKRHSHTANVFTKVYYLDPTGKARPLNTLRQEAEAAMEKKLFALSGELPLQS